MKFSLAISVFLAALARASSDDVQSAALKLARDDQGMFHVGRDGVLRSFARDLTVIDATHFDRGLETVSARDMLNPSEELVQEVRDLQEYADSQIAKRGNLEKRCGGYCSPSNSCSLLNEQACQLCISSRCGG